jgi:pimeloyl-ACP methyl ester carboxylesterase
MTIVFDEFELDPATRELRLDGAPRALQPQVFDLLLYLVENRERVVPKRELLDTLWPDAAVTESSIQRAVSLARSALGARGPELIQTFPRQGYRFVGKVRSAKTNRPGLTLQPRYARDGDVHIAYATIGEGDVDVVVVLGWVLPMRAMFKHPKTLSALEGLSKIGRVIVFDKRGTGLSDRVREVPIHEERMDDLRAVLDACGSTQAVLIGFSEGGALAMLYAASYPERVRGLVLCGAFARMTRTGDYGCGYTDEEMEKLKGYIRGAWGKGASLRAIAPSQLSDPEFVEWVAFSEQEGTSPGSALDLLDMNLRIDLRAMLPAIRVPTVVMQANDDKMIHPDNGPYLRDHIANAKYVETQGDDHVFFFETQHELFDAVEWVLSESPPLLAEDRFLSTVLVAHSGKSIDDATWHAQVARFRGQAVPGAPRAFFDGPVRALRCGAAMSSKRQASFGVHTGEVVRRGSAISGSAFDAAELIAARAPAGGVWASRVLVDLVPGTDLRFEETGENVPLQGREIATFSVHFES